MNATCTSIYTGESLPMSACADLIAKHDRAIENGAFFVVGLVLLLLILHAILWRSPK